MQVVSGSVLSDSDSYDLFFAGCARNCARTLEKNLLSILSIANEPWCGRLQIYVVENDSIDCTREILLRLAEYDPRVVPICLEQLDHQIPYREARLAYCRDEALARIFKLYSDGVYIPLDLDLSFGQSLNPESLRKVCRLVYSGQFNGIFPSSAPYYYDIHALRERSWCPVSCWQQIYDAKPSGSLMHLLVDLRFITSRQRSHAWLVRRGILPVQSAFGGIAAYSLAAIIAASSSYSSPLLKQNAGSICEHVVFNASLSNLAINPDWVVDAPMEYIAFRLLPLHQQIWRIASAFLEDIVASLRFSWRQIRRYFSVIADNS